MSNVYCTIAQLRPYLDERTSGMLSNDDGKRDALVANIQASLDAAASELDSHLAARIALPLAAVPKVLEMWVARRVKGLLFGRRTDKPRAIDDDTKWCDDWIEGWDAGRLALPGIGRAVTNLGLSGRAKQVNERAVTGLLTGDDFPSTW